MIRKYSLVFGLVALLAIGLTVVHPHKAAALTVRGYFSNQSTTSPWCDLLSSSCGGLNANLDRTGSQGGYVYTNKGNFENYIADKLNNGSLQQQVGAAFIIETMIGQGNNPNSGFQAITQAKADFNTWASYIDDSDIGLRIENFSFGTNTAYANSIRDIAVYGDNGGHNALVFYNKVTNREYYAIKTDCGNPVGNFSRLPAPSRNPSGHITARCVWNAPTNNYRYYLDGGWQDPDASPPNTANAFITDVNNKRIGYGKNRSSDTWGPFDKGNHATGNGSPGNPYFDIPDNTWPVRLWVQDVGSAGNTYTAVDDVDQPDCNRAVSGSIGVACTTDATGVVTYNFTYKYTDPDVTASQPGRAFLRNVTVAINDPSGALGGTGSGGSYRTTTSPATTTFTWSFVGSWPAPGHAVHLSLGDIHDDGSLSWIELAGLNNGYVGAPAASSCSGGSSGSNTSCVTTGILDPSILGSSYGFRVGVVTTTPVSPVAPPPFTVTMRNVNGGPSVSPSTIAVQTPFATTGNSNTLMSQTVSVLAASLSVGTYKVHWDWNGQPSGGCDANVHVVLAPYFTVRGGDSAAGAQFYAGSTCNNLTGTPASDSQIVGWNYNDIPLGSGYFGASDQGAAFALGNIRSFATGVDMKTSRAPANPNSNILTTLIGTNPYQLSFANTVTGTTDTHGSDGGQFGSLPCVGDYFSDDYDPDAVAAVGPVGLTSGSYDSNVTLGTNNGNPLVLHAGDNITIIASQNVYITNDIQVDTTGWSSAADAPQLTIITDGDITIDPGVSELHGNFIAQSGIFATCARGPSAATDELKDYDSCHSKQLTVYGTVSAHKIHLDRSWGNLLSGNGSQPADSVENSAAERFIYTPQSWVGAAKSCTAACYQPTAITSLPPIL